MRILVVGGKGTIGQAIVKKLKDNHELILAGRTSGDVQVDLTSVDSIETMFKKWGTSMRSSMHQEPQNFSW